MSYHKAALVEEGATVGPGTRVWAFVHILPGARIGADCNICDHVFIENDVIIGDRVTVKCGVQLWDGIRLEDDVFVGPNATFTNDKFPRSKNWPDKFLTTTVRAGASIGANATILPGITIGKNAMIGAGAVVARNVPPGAIVTGDQATIVGYVSTQTHEPVAGLPDARLGAHQTLGVGGTCLYELPLILDLRGNLSVAEVGTDLPFIPKRCFLVFEVPSREVRGAHAHKTLQQFLICAKGRVSVIVDDGHRKVEVALTRPNLGLYIPPRVWGIQYKYSPDAVLMVLASNAYDAEDYIRDYDEYLSFINANSGE